jgi:hypothetical protein
LKLDGVWGQTRAVLLALVCSLAIYMCSSLYGDKHALPLPALRDYMTHLARATKYLVGHKPKIRPTPIYVAPRENTAQRQRPLSLMDIRQAADNLVRASLLTAHKVSCFQQWVESSRASPPRRPREDGLTHPADNSRPNLAGAWVCFRGCGFPNTRPRVQTTTGGGSELVGSALVTDGRSSVGPRGVYCTHAGMEYATENCSAFFCSPQAVSTDTADSSRARQNVRWTVMQKGELLTVELFLSSKSVDSGTCATLWSQVAALFPEELMRVSLSYTGGGLGKDKVRPASLLLTTT